MFRSTSDDPRICAEQFNTFNYIAVLWYNRVVTVGRSVLSQHGKGIKMRSNNNSGCLTAFISSFSRIMLLMVWIARPVMMNATFSSFILPCLGFLFLPFTTLMYVFLKQGVGTIQGLDWLWLFLAVILDLATIGGAGAANRNRIPAGYPGSYPQDQQQ